MGEDNKRDLKTGRFLTGNKGGGRPVGSRNKLAEQLLTDLANEWEAQGALVLQKLATTDPGKFAQIAYNTLPRDVFLNIQHNAGPLTADERVLLQSLLQLIQRCSTTMEPGEVFTLLEDTLRSHAAKPVADTFSASTENKSGS